MRVNCNESWKPLDDINPNSGFLKFVPSLQNTPPTILKSPPNVTAINKCLESNEARVGCSMKMQSLRELRDRVYRDREEKFHWDLEDSFEMATNRPSDDQNGTIEYEDQDSDLSSTPFFDFEYGAGDMVAVKTVDGNDTFWIAEVVSVHTRTKEGVSSSLSIIWYEPDKDWHNPYEAKQKMLTALARR